MRHSEKRLYLFGNQFGPVMLALSPSESYASLEDAIDEWDERHGTRADFATEAELEQALADGEARINDGGTTVEVDPYEWFQEYRSGAELRQAWPAERLRQTKLDIVRL